MAYNRSDDDFSGLNDIPIPEDIIDQFGGGTDPIDLEDVHDDVDTQTTIGSSTKRKVTKQKAKCWDHFELVLTVNISRNTLRRDTIVRYNTKKETIINGINNYNGVVSFTSDLWTSCN
ncbi:hypothetical protein Adt_18307 [Abeliophyllum distichum]|uniref:PiggyBac transposable element-derived protein domain-containing protein n=1 Tax=Abeliophyllum distichum TaxID=126358 RepID=A0ABD1TJ13_9LAMI